MAHFAVRIYLFSKEELTVGVLSFEPGGRSRSVLGLRGPSTSSHGATPQVSAAPTFCYILRNLSKTKVGWRLF
jgi:hypothetical protein